MIEARAARVQVRLNRKQVCEAVNISRARLTSIETGRMSPTLDEVIRLAWLYKLEPTDLFFLYPSFDGRPVHKL